MAIGRRAFIALAGGGIVARALEAGPSPARAQTPGRVFRLGHLGFAGPSETMSRDIILPELARLGFAEGSNLVFDTRGGEADAQPALMRELLATQPDAVIAIGNAAILAAGAATRTVPIVCLGGDPVQLGLAQSYARPGGNVTGVTILISELEVKRLSILREAAPGQRRVAALISPTQRSTSEPALRKAAADLGAELFIFPAAAPADYPAAFAAMRAAGANALLIGAAPEFNRDARQLAALALEARLPTVCEWADLAHAGCMIGYGPNRPALRKRMAAQIAQIFRGTAPGQVAIELPSLFEFAVNLKTAKAIDLNLPQSVLVQADEVIE